MSQNRIFTPTIKGNVPEITPEELVPFLKQVTLVDVRTPEEFNSELSHIPGAKRVTLGPDLDAFLKTHDQTDEIVFVCRSGGRSGEATSQSKAAGFTMGVNLCGGMLLWNEKKLPVERKN